MTEQVRVDMPGGLLFRHRTTIHRHGKLTDLHCHSLFELIYVVSGELFHVVEGRKYRLKMGDLVLVRPSQHHYLQITSDEPYERYNFHFDPVLHGIESALQIPETVEVISLSDNSIASELFSKLDYYCAKADVQTFESLFKLLLNELFLNLRVSNNMIERKETIISLVLTKALEYINNHLCSVADVEEVAQAQYISSSYLFYLFRNTLHQTPKRYINEKRLLLAQRRICAGEKPTVACKECGFKEYTTFYRSYCSFFGHPPSQDCGSALRERTDM